MSADWDETLISEAQIRERLRDAGYDFRQTSVPKEIMKLAILLAVCFTLFEMILRNPLVSRLNLFPTATAGMSMGAIFLIGVMTSLHCLAMCGGINLSQSGRSALHGGDLWRSNLQYNGIIGGALNRRFGRPLQWISAGLVLFMGIGMMVNGVSLAGISAARTGETLLSAEITADGSAQLLTTELEWNSYPDFTVYAGIPLKWTIHASADKLIGCNNEILIPAYDIDIRLHEGDNLIEFTPAARETVPYSCWMGMIRASITVIDPH